METSSAAARAIAQAGRETFEHDGVVCLREILDDRWIDRMRAAAARVVDATADMTAIAAPASSSQTTPGRFRAGTDHWRVDEDFAAFATTSILPGAVAALLGSDRLVLYEDSLLVKEPRTAQATRWHQDLGYFHVTGRQIATTWCPLDEVDESSGAVRYVRGSHRWGRLFRPNLFVTDEPIPDTAGEPVPDVEATIDPRDIIAFSTCPGDVVVHHAETLHAAGPNQNLYRSRRAISVRYCGDDARAHIRPGAPLKPEQAGWGDGARLVDLNESSFPLVFPPA